MEDTVKILEDVFENEYSEYTLYNNYVKSISKKIAKEREEFAKFALQNKEDMEKVLDHMFDVNEKPALLGLDIVKLQTRLFNTYNVVKDIIDIPKEIREEINSLPKPRLAYKIENGEAVAIDPKANEETRKYAKDQGMRYVKDLLKMSK